MIVKIHSNGKSFVGAAAYLTHDPQAQTSDRVAWTHTLNLANDHVPSAVSEMVWTARDAELLKQEAGVRAGGRQTENPVKTLSLNWAPQDNPSQEYMIATTQEFLRHMKWEEHEAILIAHQDKSYKHVHVMLNVIHPETGLRLNDSYERVRAQAWALQYEREQGRIYCEERLKDQADRAQSPPRNIWLAFQQQELEFTRAEKALGENQQISRDQPENQENAEWRILKEIQQDERKRFFVDGKSAFSELRNSIYREVREEFRERWADYYEQKRNGFVEDADLAALKKGIAADQAGLLQERRDAACAALRTTRDGHYRELLDEQKEARAELRWRLELGLDNADFLSELAARGSSHEMSEAFRATAHEVTRDAEADAPQVATAAWSSPGEGPTRSGIDMQDNLADAIEDVTDDANIEGRIYGAVGGFIGSLFEELINLGSARQPLTPQRDASGRDPFKAAAEETLRQQQQRDREEEEAERQRRQRVPGD